METKQVQTIRMEKKRKCNKRQGKKLTATGRNNGKKNLYVYFAFERRFHLNTNKACCIHSILEDPHCSLTIQ